MPYNRIMQDKERENQTGLPESVQHDTNLHLSEKTNRISCCSKQQHYTQNITLTTQHWTALQLKTLQ